METQKKLMLMLMLCVIFPSYFSNSLALDSELLHLREVVVECHNVRDDGLLIWVLCEHIYTTEWQTSQSQPSQRYNSS